MSKKVCIRSMDDCGYLGSRPCTTPMDSKQSFISETSQLLHDPSTYKRIVGKLLYLTITRPDISYSIQTLTQFMSQPTEAHLSAVHRLLRYLKTNPGQGIFYSNNNTFKLQAFTDSDWGRCEITRRSITKYAVYLGDSLASWKSKKQPKLVGLQQRLNTEQWLQHLVNCSGFYMFYNT